MDTKARLLSVVVTEGKKVHVDTAPVYRAAVTRSPRSCIERSTRCERPAELAPAGLAPARPFTSKPWAEDASHTDSE